MQCHWFTLILIALVAQTGLGAELRETVDGDKQQCQAYLNVPDVAPTRTLVFYVLGTGFTTASEPLHPLAKYWFYKKNTSVLTFEKPGVIKHDASWSSDHVAYSEHTPDDLLKCAMNALQLAEAKVPDLQKVILIGHSEGVEVLLRMYHEIYKTLPALAKKIKILQATSAHLEGWDALANFQLKDESARAEFDSALEAGDELYFQQNGTIPLRYWKQALKLPPASELVQDLEDKPLVVQFYQGRRDKQVSPKALESLEAWANKKESRKKQTKFRWFDAGHDLEEKKDSVIEMMISDSDSSV